MSRFFVPKESVKGNIIHVAADEAHHILDVMRLKVLDEVTVFDGTGKEYTGIVRAADRKTLEVQIKSMRESSVGRDSLLTLIQAITKKDKMDYIAEKATELGVSRIIPVITERTIPEWNDEKKTSVVERWRKIAQEAAKQSGRLDIPEILPIRSFLECVKDIDDYDIKLIAALSDRAIKIKDVLTGCNGVKIAIAIGPEGDFTPHEIEEAVKADFKVVNLGPLTLKSDTAGLAVLSIISYERRD